MNDPQRLGRVAARVNHLRRTSNEVFFPLFFEEARYLVLMGGGGSGKSVFAGRKLVERAYNEPGHRFLVCRKVARTLRESCFKQLSEQCENKKCRIYRGEMRITFRNGSEILFAGLDDVEKLKSIFNITGIWIEEASELSESDFDQLDIRLRGVTPQYKQIILTFNPISATHWLKTRFFDVSSPHVHTHHSTYKDNVFLDEEYRRVLESFKDTDDYYYSVYCLGQWGVTGQSVFNAADVQKRLNDGIKPVKTGMFTQDGEQFTWRDDKDGFIKIYAEPAEGQPYVIGGDTAGDGSDCFIGQVLDNVTGRQAAILRHTFDEDVYAKQMFALGRYYNNALIGIETNFSTYPVKMLEQMSYPRLFVRETEDSYTHNVKKSYGIKTTAVTRPVMIANLIAVIREDITLVCDETTLLEMLTFVRNEKLRPQAQNGAKDDCVMALAIAHYIRPQMSMVNRKKKSKSWTEDMWEDYHGASKEGREYLLKKWG